MSNGSRARPVRPSPRTEARIESTSRSSRELVDGVLLPAARVAARRALGHAGRRGFGQQLDVHPNDRKRRPQLVGHDAQQLGPGSVQRRQPGETALDLGLEAALLDDPGQECGDRAQELDFARPEPADLGRLDVEHADHLVVPDQRHRQHRVKPGDVEAPDPAEAPVGGDVGDLDRLSPLGGDARDALAERQAHLAHLARIEAVRGREGQPQPLPVGQVERADLDVHRLGRAVDDRPHELVPVAGQRGASWAISCRNASSRRRRAARSCRAGGFAGRGVVRGGCGGGGQPLMIADASAAATRGRPSPTLGPRKGSPAVPHGRHSYEPQPGQYRDPDRE